MTRARIALAAVAAAACLLATAGPARAYVRYRTETGVPFAWSSTCLGIIVYPAPIADMMPADQVVAAAAAATGAWSAPQVAGTALDIQVAATDGDLPGARNDGQNSLLFLRSNWCDTSDPVTSCTHDPSALALTTVFARKTDGHIVDADIEVNVETFMWADLELDTQASADLNDLQNALTHEVGHFIGLDHPCVLPGTAPGGVPPLDNLDNPAPDCDVAPAAILESTMFPSAMPGDLSKRTLAADDELAAREIYPASAGPAAVCPAPKPKAVLTGGCALAGDAAPAPGALAFLAVALALGATRARRRATRVAAAPRS